MPQYFIAHDLGTSGNKASLFTTEGKLVCSHTAPYDVHFFHGNYAEQNPEDWWQAIIASTRKIIKDIPAKDVLAISFSAQMQCCLIVNKDGVPLRPAIIWADQRAEKEKQLLEDKIGFDRMYEITGHRVSASYSLAKLMWIKNHEPQLYAETKYMLQAKDYIIYRLTGAYVTDYSDASGTNAMDLKNLCWSKEILSAAEIAKEKLPPLHPSTDIAGTLTKEAAALLRLTEQTKVVIGGGDGPCSALGAGCIHADELFLTFGTSAWIGGTTDTVFTTEDKVIPCFAHVIPGRYMPCGTMQAAGSSYSYIRSALCREETDAAEAAGLEPFEIMNRLIESSPAGAKNLLFLPYLLGERCPRWNPDTSGSFLGIKPCHEKADYVRAVIEGIAMNLELILSVYRRKLPAKRLIFTGGGAKGDVVAKIIANVLQAELVRPDNVEEATSIAAAVIAGVGTGVYEDFSAVEKFLSVQDAILPEKETARIYEPLKKLFDESYHALEKIYDAFAALNGAGQP